MTWRILPLLVAVPLFALAQDAVAPAATPPPAITLDAKDEQIRTRYEQALLGNPLQEQAFDRIYESYLSYEGLDTWVTKLKDALAAQPDASHAILLGRVYDRQFKTAEAIQALEQAKSLGEARPEFQLLLGSIYYDAGRNAEATELLSAALDTIADPDQRARVVRLLGSLYMRQGKRDEAMAAWKRLTDRDPNDMFALLELSAIYEENQMWDDVIATQQRIADASANDPYRKCRALRDIGQALIQQEKYPEAISTFEKALELVAPGNWLFEDLKLRLVTVYQDMGDLEGLSQYILAKLAQAPGDVEFRDLLAETYTRMQKFDQAEAEHKLILERDPNRSSTYEKLLSLYDRMQKPDNVIATYEKLIELFPTEPDYVRRLGEAHLNANKQDVAKLTWQRIVATEPTPEHFAQLAEWYEEYEFPDEAVAAYEQALQGKKEKDWAIRLGMLKHEKGDDDAAHTIWTSVLDDATSAAADYSEIASLLESNNLAEKAEPLQRKAIEKDPQNAEYPLALAKNLMRLERGDEAAVLFEQSAAQSDNEYVRDQGEKGMLDAYDAMGVLQEKQKAWEADVDANPDKPEALLRLARLYERLGDRAKSTALYERCVELSPDSTDYLRTLASAYKGGKQMQECIATYAKLIEKDKDRAGGYYRELLEMYVEADLKKEALETARKIVETAPSNAESRLDLAQVLQTYLQHDEALEQYRYALRLEPNEPDYFRQYAEALQSLGRLGEAQEAFRKMFAVAKEDDTRRQAATMLADIYQRQDKHEELAREFQNRIRNTPKRLAAYQDLAAIYAQIGDHTRAMAVLEDGLNTVDERVPALQALVRAAFDAQDYPRILSYYEQLVAASGKPTSQELEKLGQVYADMGEVDKARETWARITTEDPKNPKAYLTLAGALERAGFAEESLAAQAQALELNPGDFKTRMAYATDLSNSGQTDAAIEQLQRLLEIGDPKAKEEEEKSKEKKVKGLNRGRQGSYKYYSSYGGYQRMYRGGGKQSFATVRKEAISMMAAWSEGAMGIEALVEEYKKKVEANAANVQAKRDLMTIYQTVNQAEQAIATGEELIAQDGTDAELIEQVAQLYLQQRNIEKAVALLTRLSELQPLKRKDILQQQMNLYGNADEQKFNETVTALLTEFGDDANVVQEVSVNLLNLNKFDQVKAMRERLETIDPQYRNNMRSHLALAYQRSGDMAEANKLYEQMVFSDDDYQRNAIYRRRGRGNVYAPLSLEDRQNRGSFAGPRIYNLTNLGVISSNNYVSTSAVDALIMRPESADTAAATIAKMEEVARGYAAAASQVQRDRAWDMGKILIAYAIVKDEYDRAQKYLDEMKQAGVDDTDWYNLSIYLREVQDKYAEMPAIYDELQKQQPQRSKEILMARIKSLLSAEDFTAASQSVGELIGQGIPPSDVVHLITQFEQADQREMAMQLTEKLLGQSGRNSEALALMARLYGSENNYEKALELAKEAWIRKSRSTRNASRYYYGYGYYYGNQAPDDLLGNLYDYAQGAGKTAELIAEFEERLAKQPGSVELHRNLAALYQRNDDVDKAMAVWDGLVQKRPNFTEAKMARAEILQNRGRYQDAIAVYEAIVKTNPSLFRSISWRVRDLYRRAGQGEKLKALEDDLIAKATNPDQLQDVAYQFKENGEYQKAIDLFAKVIKTAPDRTWAHSQLADTLCEMGRYDDALAAYTQWIDSPITRAQGWSDYSTIGRMVGLYRGVGKLPELKAKSDAEFAANPADKIARAMQTEIALYEKRIPDARALIEESITKYGDHNAGYELANILEFETDLAALAKTLEAAQRQNMYSNFEQLGQLYFATGNPDKAYETWQNLTNYYGGSYGLVRVVQHLLNNGMYDKAEEFFVKNRGSFQDWEGREVGRTVVRAYFYGQGFTNYVERLKSDKVRGGDEQFVQRLLEMEEVAPAWKRDFLAALLEKDPESEELLKQQARLLLNMHMHAERVPVLEKLCAKDEASTSYRSQLAEAMRALGREDEATAMLTAWTDQRFTLESAISLSRYLRGVNPREAIALRARALEKLDASQKDDIVREGARMEAELGNVEAAKTALREQFEQRKEEGTFSRLFEFLQDRGYYDEAHALYLENKDQGFLDQWGDSPGRLTRLCLVKNDPDTLLDVCWRFTRYGDRWNSGDFLRQVLEEYRKMADARPLLVAFEDRLSKETEPLPLVWEKLGEIYELANEPERALAVAERLQQLTPQKSSVLLKKSEALRRLRRYDEATAILSQIPSMSLREEATAQTTLARQFFEIGRVDDAARVLGETQAWATASWACGDLGSAYMLLESFDKALPLLERAALVGYGNNNERQTLALAYGRVGRVDDCLRMSLLQLQSGGPLELVNQLVDFGAYDAAVKLCDEHLTRMPADKGVRLALATIRARQGDKAGAVKTMEDGYPQIAPNRQHDYAGGSADWLVDAGCIEAAAAQVASAPSPLLEWALALALLSAAREDEADAVAALRTIVAPLPMQTASAAIAMGDALLEANDKPAAAEWYRKALLAADLQRENKQQAVVGLVKCGDAASAAPSIVELTAATPSLWLTNFAYIAGVAKAGTPEQLAAALEKIKTIAPYDSHIAFYESMANFHAGKNDVALPALAGLIDTPNLTLEHLLAIADSLREAGRVDDALRAIDRIAALGFNQGGVRGALADAIEWCAVTHPAKAIGYYARLWPQTDAQSLRAQRLLANAANATTLPAMREAIAATISANPAHGGVSELAGLYKELSECAGAPETAEAFAAALGVAGSELVECQAWDRLIENWQVYASEIKRDSGAFRYDLANERKMAADGLAALFPAGAAYFPVEKQQALGIIDVDRALHLRGSARENKQTYAVTGMQSLDERDVVLSGSFDDRARVWVNGVAVYEQTQGQTARPDAVRFKAHLKQGENVIVIRLGNEGGEWRFCLGIKEGGEGVTVVSPGVTAPATVAAAA